MVPHLLAFQDLTSGYTKEATPERARRRGGGERDAPTTLTNSKRNKEKHPGGLLFFYADKWKPVRPFHRCTLIGLKESQRDTLVKRLTFGCVRIP